MSVTTAYFTVTRSSLQMLVQLARWARLDELHVIQGRVQATMAWRGIRPEFCPRVVADLSAELGQNFDLHVKVDALRKMIRALRKMIRALRGNDHEVLQLEVSERYTFKIPIGKYFLKRLAAPTATLAGLRSENKQRIGSVLVDKDTLGQLKGACHGGRLPVDLFFRQKTAYMLGVRDTPRSEAYQIHRWLNGATQEDWPAEDAELVLRARVFMPHWLKGTPECTVWLLPHEQPCYWLMTSMPLGSGTVLFQEPLELVREQCRQRGETEIDGDLAQLTDG